MAVSQRPLSLAALTEKATAAGLEHIAIVVMERGADFRIIRFRRLTNLEWSKCVRAAHVRQIL